VARRALARELGSFFTAATHAALAGLAGRPGSGVSIAEGEAEADTAMFLLRKSLAMHYRSALYRTEEALERLRGRDDFQLPMMDLAMPADPFATAR
jgi:hypothetical protein